MLLRDLDQIVEELGINHRSIMDYDRSVRTIKLEWIIRYIARGAVLEWYTFIDELLADQICWYYFGRKREFWKLWKTERFKIFNYHIIQDMYLLEKLRLVRAIREVPRKVVAEIQALNTLRNGLAHAYFPENLKKTRPTWKNKNIFSVGTLSHLNNDMRIVRDFFVVSERAYRHHSRTIVLRRSGSAGQSTSPAINASTPSRPMP
jgi:hypothetical protein